MTFSCVCKLLMKLWTGNLLEIIFINPTIAIKEEFHHQSASSGETNSAKALIVFSPQSKSLLDEERVHLYSGLTFIPYCNLATTTFSG